MRSRDLHPGDRVEVNVRGVRFEARVRNIDAVGNVSIDPCESWITYRTVSPRRIVRRIRNQQRMEVGA